MQVAMRSNSYRDFESYVLPDHPAAGLNSQPAVVQPEWSGLYGLKDFPPWDAGANVAGNRKTPQETG